jgi:hypothetical protein
MAVRFCRRLENGSVNFGSEVESMSAQNLIGDISEHIAEILGENERLRSALKPIEGPLKLEDIAAAVQGHGLLLEALTVTLLAPRVGTIERDSEGRIVAIRSASDLSQLTNPSTEAGEP